MLKHNNTHTHTHAHSRRFDSCCIIIKCGRKTTILRMICVYYTDQTCYVMNKFKAKKKTKICMMALQLDSQTEDNNIILIDLKKATAC